MLISIAPSTASTAVKLRFRPFPGSALGIRHLRLFSKLQFWCVDCVNGSESHLVVLWVPHFGWKEARITNLKVLRKLPAGTSRWLQSHKLMRLEARHMPPSNIILAIQCKSLIATSQKLEISAESNIHSQSYWLEIQRKALTVQHRATCQHSHVATPGPHGVWKFLAAFQVESQHIARKQSMMVEDSWVDLTRLWTFILCKYVTSIWTSQHIYI